MFVSKAFAQVTAQDLGVNDSIGNIGGIFQIFSFLFHLFVYLGWVGTLMGAAYTLFLLIYKQFSSGDRVSDFEKFTESLKKAIFVIVLGLLCLGAGFVIKVVSDLTGANLDLSFSIFNL